MLQDIIRASERAADLTRQLLAYAGKGKFVVERVDASAVVRDISELIRSSVPRTVELSLDLHPDLPPLEGDPSQIQQLVMNLILNAVEATGERPGRVFVATRICDIGQSEPVTKFRPDPPPGRYIEIQVSDNGCGMNEAVKAQIFDPFFTTKFTGRGLGLSAALGIVRSHKGVIAVESAEGTGSTFSVLMPAIAAAAGPKDSGSAASAAVETGAGVILIVDDEELVRRAARATLEHFGYTVFEAADGRDGADLFSRWHDRISAVLLDLTMPRMDGYDVWRYIRGVRPDMTVVISSGFEESDAMRQFTDDPALLFLKKPFTAAALAHKIGAALDRRKKR
jgi:CheY-like chemotaxis protein